MPDAPTPAPGRPLGDFKARLNRDIAFTIIDEQIRSGIDQSQLTGRGLAKQYGFGSPQTWVTHLKDWRQQHGYAAAAPEEGVREAERESEPLDGESAGEARPEGAQTYGMISRSEFLQHQEMWNRLLAEREQAHAERLKVARLEGVDAGRAVGRDEAKALAEARERALEERARRERLEGERDGMQRAQAEVARRARGERWLLAILAFVLGAAGGIAVWATRPTVAPPAPAPAVPISDPAVPTPDPVPSTPDPVVPTPDPVVPTPDPVPRTPEPATPDPVAP